MMEELAGLNSYQFEENHGILLLRQLMVHESLQCMKGLSIPVQVE